MAAIKVIMLILLSMKIATMIGLCSQGYLMICYALIKQNIKITSK